ncbi:hypothetical protein QTQ03_01885 [Micromonospora sp. WMMA1363]|uniref:hypothetical protein n=1 Tax=Micromonospora sp. WMMA1363 TaxID=3053985 RepID=UPI00259C68F0|nr:hypothetical protein [Micromonospora sp. WMMA1363]MDM4718399.1 hypothetical protein [Micromonospora sp. WMMA1363]
MVRRAGRNEEGNTMKGWLPLTLGLLAVVFGALWTVQGLGYVESSVMSGVRLWAFVGPVVALAGLVVLWLGLRARNRR